MMLVRSAHRTVLRLATGAMLILMLVAGCGLLQGVPGAQTFCDGISSEVGGCDPDRPSFTGETCDEIAREFGVQVDERSMAIIRGPESSEASKAVRVTHVKTLSASLVNQYLREEGLIAECGADEFLAVAEGEFSDELKAEAGNYLHDGPPATYDEWLAELRAFLEIIDMEEDA